MKKLAVLIILALAACVAYVAIAGEGAGAQPNFIDHYKCYQARHAKRSPRFQSTTVFLTDQFRDNVEVNVIKLNTHCSSANQTGYGGGNTAGEFDNGLDCYTVRDKPGQERFRTQNVDVRDKLTDWDLQTLTVSKAQSLCVPSLKFLPKGTLEGESFVCYQAKTAKGQPRFQQQSRGVDDQFDDKDVRILRPVAYCALSEKKLDAPNDDFNNDSDYRTLPNGDVCESPYFCDIHLSTVHSTLESNDPIISCKTEYSNSVWFDWSDGTNASLILDTEGSSYDTVLAVFTGDKSTLTQNQVGCNDDVDLCDPVVLDGAAAGGGCCSFLNGQSTAGCCQAVGSPDAAGCCIIVVPGNSDAGCCSTGSAEGAGCCLQRTADAAGCGCPIQAIPLGGPAGDSGCILPSSFLQFDAWAGTTYHILVGSSDGHGGKLKLHIRTKSEDSDADSCGDPHGIGSLDFVGDSDFIHLSTMNATFADGVSVAGGPCPGDDPTLSCASDYGASEWFTYTPNAHEIVNWDSSESSYPTALAIFNPSINTPLYCFGSGSGSSELKEGQKYLIEVVSTDEDNNFRGGKLKLFLDEKDRLGSPDGSQGGVTPQGTPDSLTCYQVRQARHQTETDNLYDQFSLRQTLSGKNSGFWTLTIGAVETLCVPSNKNNCTRYTYQIGGAGEGEDASLCYFTG